jgi:hypothetical protein
MTTVLTLGGQPVRVSAMSTCFSFSLCYIDWPRGLGRGRAECLEVVSAKQGEPGLS